MLKKGSGPWKQFLSENPFDIRRAFVATKVAEKLVSTTLIGKPAVSRGYHYGNQKPASKPSPHHSVYVDTKASPQ